MKNLLAAPLIASIWLIAFVCTLLLVALSIVLIGAFVWLELADNNKDPLSLAVVATRVLWSK